ncbi:MAG: hypothetical protein JW809_08055, partial [Pirellulales bacterium]|nr:hypothetical protein [Pirellulales bacterium]
GDRCRAKKPLLSIQSVTSAISIVLLEQDVLWVASTLRGMGKVAKSVTIQGWPGPAASKLMAKDELAAVAFGCVVPDWQQMGCR